MKKINLLLLSFVLTLLCACNTNDVEYKYPKARKDRIREEMGSVLTGSNEEVTIIGGKTSSKTISSNTYLWKASLDVISFMPIASSDSVGGTIITDWYIDEKAPNERFKFNIIIASNELDATSLKVRGFKEVKAGNGWKNVAMSEEVTKDIEMKILTLARKMKVSRM